MKKLLALACLFGVSSISAAYAGGGVVPIDDKANPTFMIGIAVEFGDNVNKADVGLTAKVLSSDRPDSFVFGGGVTYFPWAKEQLGLDLSAGYNFNNFGALAGYDFLRWRPQISAGYIHTNDGQHCADGGPIIDGYCDTPK